MSLRLTDPRFVLGVIVFTALYVVSDLTLLAGMTEPTFAVQTATTIMIGVVFALVMGTIFTSLPLRRRVRILLAWPALFVIQWFNSMLEGYFYTTMLTESLLLAGLLFGLLISFFHALLVALLFPTYHPSRPLRSEFHDYFRQHSGPSWLGRFAVSSASFLPIYYTLGHLISPLVLPFYLASDLDLRVPPVPVIIGLQLLRGFLYVAAILPILATLRIDPKPQWILIALLLYIPGVAMLLPDPTLPAILRAIHGIEILIDSLLFGAVITYLLGTRSPSPKL